MTTNVFFQGLPIAQPLHSFCFVIGELSLGLPHASQYSHIGLHPISKSFLIICISGS